MSAKNAQRLLRQTASESGRCGAFRSFVRIGSFSRQSVVIKHNLQQKTNQPLPRPNPNLDEQYVQHDPLTPPYHLCTDHWYVCAVSSSHCFVFAALLIVHHTPPRLAWAGRSLQHVHIICHRQQLTTMHISFPCLSTTGSIVEIDAGLIGNPSIVDDNVSIVAAMNSKIDEVRHVFVPHGHSSSLF